MERSSPRWFAQGLGLLRIGAWLGLWAIVTAPWTGLGGLVDERLRWLVPALSGQLGICGVAVGAATRYGTGGAVRESGAAHRRLVLPALVVAAFALLVTELRSLLGASMAAAAEDVANLVVAVTVAWCAGVDVGRVAWPLARAVDRQSAARARGDREDSDARGDANGGDGVATEASTWRAIF